jgi:hypothetical protein
MGELHKVLMFGDRFWSDIVPIRRELRALIKVYGTRDLVIIEGECPTGGADILARLEAEALNVHVVRVHGLWQTRYRSAGPQRNRIMRLLGPDEGIGFHADLKKSKGTKDMAGQLKRAGIPYRIVEG